MQCLDRSPLGAGVYCRYPFVTRHHLPASSWQPRASFARSGHFVLPGQTASRPLNLARAAARGIEGSFAITSQAFTPSQLYEISEGLETPIQLIYLLALLGVLSVGAYLVVRQVLIRQQLDEAAKALGERIRTNEATCEDYFELGVILTRKRLYTQATKNFDKAKRIWDGEPSELAQVHNALGFCYFNMEKVDMAVAEYRKAVELQPGYVTAWNNLGDAYEKMRKWPDAIAAYQQALNYAPTNKVAQQRKTFCESRLSFRS